MATRLLSALLVAALAAVALGAAIRGQTPAERLIDAAFTQSQAMSRLIEMTDLYGPRLCGSEALEQSIDWVVAKMKSEDNFDNVYTEDVMVPHWVRNQEYLYMTSPRRHNFSILGLGNSVGTNGTELTAEAIVVRSFDELDQRKNEVRGKIVVYNPVWTGYGPTVAYRSDGAARAAVYGAVASLVRSVTPYSLNTPHTGMMNHAPIPGAAITTEDADMLQRMHDRGDNIVLSLFMGAETLPDAPSRNIIAEIYGYEKPEEVVVFGGHIDSWDVGTGVLDDAGGAFVAWEALRLMAKLNLRPRRTARLVFWTDEENSSRGADAYYNNRKEEIPLTSWAFESDSGIFYTREIGFTGSDEAFAIMQAIGAEHLSSIGAGNVTTPGGGVDIDPLCQRGVPCSSLNVVTGEREDKTDSYFYYHHTAADTVSAMREDEVNQCVAAMAVWVYYVADLEDLLPR